MNKFVLITDSFPGNLTFFYDSDGHLTEFQNNSWGMTSAIIKAILGQFEHWIYAPTFNEWAIKYRYKVRREKIDVGFERFWNMYGAARDRHICEPKWNKMSEKQRYYILINLKAYNRYCARNKNYSKLAPKTYIGGAYNNDWDKVNDVR